MAGFVCPWWLGFGLASPFRRLVLDPESLVAPYVEPEMMVLEPGPGMGFFTLPMARRVGTGGRVVAVDIQRRMLDGLGRKARRAGLAGRVELRLAGADGLGIEDLAARIDFCLAYAMVHEVPDPVRLFREIAGSLGPDGRVLFGEPKWHVSEKEFSVLLTNGREAGLRQVERLSLRSLHAAVLVRA
jgi:SAM-dependent methyltransferase